MGELPNGQGGGLCVEPWPCSSFPQRLSSASQELNNRLAAEITRLRTLLTGEGGGEAAGSPLTQGKDAYELEVSSLPCQRGSVGGHKCLWPPRTGLWPSIPPHTGSARSVGTVHRGQELLAF